MSVFNGQRSVTVYVATAMAIVMKYHADHGLADTGTGSHTYSWNGQELTVEFGTYAWMNMPKITSGFTNDMQRNAVARLMSHYGISIEVSGRILYQEKIPAGAAVFKVGDLPRGFLIVRGSSGWVKKLIKN